MQVPRPASSEAVRVAHVQQTHRLRREHHRHERSRTSWQANERISAHRTTYTSYCSVYWGSSEYLCANGCTAHLCVCARAWMRSRKTASCRRPIISHLRSPHSPTPHHARSCRYALAPRSWGRLLWHDWDVHVYGQCLAQRIWSRRTSRLQANLLAILARLGRKLRVVAHGSAGTCS